MKKPGQYLLFLTALFAYLIYRLDASFFHLILLFSLASSALVYPRQWMRQSRLPSVAHFWRMKCFFDLGILSFLFSFVLARDLFLGPVILFSPDWHPLLFGHRSSSVIIALSFGSLAFGIWSATRGPAVKNVKISIQKLPDDLVGYKIAQVSDLHVGPTVGRRYVRQVVKRVNQLRANLTVLTGDIVDGEVDDHLESARELAHLEPRQQIFFVPGNHEYYWDGPRWMKHFEEWGFHVLQNTRKIIRHLSEEILVAGIVDPACSLALPHQRPDLESAMGDAHSAAVKILLSHRPDPAVEAAQTGFHLQLSGHTHAGQFFPFTLLIHTVEKFVRGLQSCGPMWIYVNQGTGYWGPPIRLGSRTEITLIELTR